MRKRIFSIFLAVAMIFCFLPLSAYADEHQHTFENKHGYDLSNLPDGYSIPCKIYESPCSDECGYSLYSWDVFGLSGQFVDKSGTSGLTVYQHYREWFEKIYGKNATAKKYETGGGSAGTGGAGRNPSGYSGTGVPTYNADGEYQLAVYPSLSFTGSKYQDYPADLTYGTNSAAWKVSGLSLSGRAVGAYSDKVQLYYKYELKGISVPGLYYIKTKQSIITHRLTRDHTTFDVTYIDANSFSVKLKSTSPSVLVKSNYNTFYIDKVGNANSTVVSYFHPIIFSVIPDTPTIKQQTNITINNNTWNGNIYQDNSTNLTYIYPQYTTINENNETVTNISNNPIIYNNETKQYYTYDTVTNNYYYITYEAPTPSPSPDPDPTPTPGPGGDTGDTTGILAVLVEIRDNMIQGFADIKATLVQGWADLSANFTLAIENLNLNITNIFNKKFPDQSTPETAEPSPSPSPSPEPSPSPTPDPGETPTPTPAPTDKPSNGNTNNFWNFVFPGGNDDGTENGHKGILWALISLLIAVVTFVLGLGSAYSYVFPFLPAGLVTTIHICVLVLLLFAIIKFVRSFL